MINFNNPDRFAIANRDAFEEFFDCEPPYPQCLRCGEDTPFNLVVETKTILRRDNTFCQLDSVVAPFCTQCYKKVYKIIHDFVNDVICEQEEDNETTDREEEIL